MVEKIYLFEERKTNEPIFILIHAEDMAEAFVRLINLGYDYNNFYVDRIG